MQCHLSEEFVLSRIVSLMNFSCPMPTPQEIYTYTSCQSHVMSCVASQKEFVPVPCQPYNKSLHFCHLPPVRSRIISPINVGPVPCQPSYKSPRCCIQGTSQSYWTCVLCQPFRFRTKQTTASPSHNFMAIHLNIKGKVSRDCPTKLFNPLPLTLSPTAVKCRQKHRHRA